ncbi:hypothetical protein ABC766_27255 [Methylobacterium fujisawaense]|uniref:hypothetical protein n=1 Tax=Methylobacterium fujisawaense TaxID=107400 RepID=UPI0031F5B6B9
MSNKIVTLDRPIMGHRPYRQLEFREPKFRDLMELGDPYVWVPAGNEYSRRVDDTQIIAKYAERLLVEDGKAGDPLILDQLGVTDTRKVREAIVDFFQPAAAAAASNTSPESSSLTQDSAPTA